MFLEILSAEEKIFSGEVESVILPGSSGQFQILNNHAPIISSLKKGEIIYKENSKDNTLAVNGGIVEVLDNKVSALIEK
ncbi:MAG: ATP synthase F1 subunit epsilon [Flammeovirgaceae bacterium]|jgi:F-type H+-transporting ATPase subunit epsilon|nr:ATP synthase F1 subunit epsilon [Flammeovirgaceae bacterium]|tara:strand:- start:1056 stop:1292 length:237 start_codon:yes stop_codon:yes gene_type:complete